MFIVHKKKIPLPPPQPAHDLESTQQYLPLPPPQPAHDLESTQQYFNVREEKAVKFLDH